MAHDTHTVQIGSASFDPNTQRLKLGEREVRLHPKDMGVLLELLAHAPEVVSREELLDRVWTGTVVGENALDQVIARLRHALGDDSRHPACIETLPKRGYRLIAPVSRTIICAASNVVSKENGGDAAWWRLTVTFLPLTTIGTDAALAQYAQVASEDIASHLADMKSVRVIAPESTRVGGRTATFLAQGHVRRVPDKLRVSVQVARTDSGDVLWSQAFDEPLQNAWADQFARAPFVARSIEGVVNRALWAERASTPSEEARKQFFYGVSEADSVNLGTGGDVFAAVDYFERALQLDPALKEALYMLASLYSRRLGGTIRADKAIPRAHELAASLLRIDPDATMALGVVNSHLDFDYPSAMANLEHARKYGFLDLSTAEFQKGLVRAKEGRFDEAIARIQAAIGMGLSVLKANALNHLADVFHAAGCDEQALASLDEARNYTVAVPLRWRLLRVGLLDGMGHHAKARRELDDAWQQDGERHAGSFPGVLAILGRREQAAAILRQNDSSWRDGRLTIAANSFAGHYHLANFDEAFTWLHRTIENREGELLPFLRSERFYPNIRGDTRFARAMARLAQIEAMGSPTRSVAAP